MFLLLSVVIGAVSGLLWKGKLVRLVDPGLRGLLLPVGAFFLETVSLRCYSWVPVPYTAWMWASVCVTYGLIGLFILLNRRYLAASVLMGAGTLGNFLCIAFNGWKMPVSPAVLNIPGYVAVADTSKDMVNYFVAVSGARLYALSDIIYVPVPLLRGFASIGDFLMAVGIVILVFSVMTRDPGKATR